MPVATLVTAVLAAVAIVALPLAPSAGRPRAAPDAVTSIPSGLITTVPTRLPDGSSYALRYVLGPDSSLGTSMAVDGTSFRLMQLVNGRPVAVVRRLPTTSAPQFDGFTAADGTLYWIETVVRPDSVSRWELWSAPIDPGDATVGPPRQLLDDMGLVVIFDSAYDLIVADGTISWVVAADPVHPGTVLRSVSVSGGKFTDRGFSGPWRQVGRPWMSSASIGAASILNVDTGQVVAAPATASDFVECGPQWCHFAVQSDAGTLRLGLMRPDGTQRIRIAGPDTQFETHDPALLGRYELFSESGPDMPGGERRLRIYDIKTGTTRLVEAGPGGLAANRGPYVWWISGDYRSSVWHVLDLRALA